MSGTAQGALFDGADNREPDEVPPIPQRRPGTWPLAQPTRQVFLAKRFVGMLDANGIYQFRGEALRTMVYWPARCVALGVDEWLQIKPSVRRMELIDLPSWLVYVVDVERVHDHGEWIDTPRGRRFGIPLKCWDAFDADGRLRKRSQLTGDRS